MCPLVLELKKQNNIDTVVCLTGQHKEMLNQVMTSFNIKEDYNLDIMKDKQTLTTITTAVLEKLEIVLDKEKPDLVLVHGDTTTSYAAALASFYKMIPVGHVEAGLRSNNIYSPFPEEMNRIMTDKISTYHFAPTNLNKQNLYNENIKENVYVTGNTVIDAFKYTVKDDYKFNIDLLNNIDYKNKKVIVLTAHRRENLGVPLKNIFNAVKRLAIDYKDAIFIYPVHLNPLVNNTAHEILDNVENIKLIDPIDVLDMHNLLARSYFVMTDSGGLQEEAPHFGKPVLVLRTETERPEAVEAGTVKVVGVEEENIYKESKILFDDKNEYNKMARAINPYGDGHASERIVKTILDKINEVK